MMSFIGIGAQKAGTSWVYTCLYEHPEVCAPQKEIHFFSRPRYDKGVAWYEANFSKCPMGTKCGEFSTSYLCSPDAAERIHEHYPSAKLIAIVREPIARAYSQYGNAIKSGEVAMSTSFEDFVSKETSCFEQGQYMSQLERYLKFFPRKQLLVLIYEDIARDPAAFMKKIYEHIGVDSSFIPPSLHTQVNIARRPKLVMIDRAMHHIAESMRKLGFDRIVHSIKTSGLTDIIRSINTQPQKEKKDFDRTKYLNVFQTSVEELGGFLGRDLVTEWKYETRD